MLKLVEFGDLNYAPKPVKAHLWVKDVCILFTHCILNIVVVLPVYWFVTIYYGLGMVVLLV